MRGPRECSGMFPGTQAASVFRSWAEGREHLGGDRQARFVARERFRPAGGRTDKVCLAHRRDIQVHPEEVCGVVLGLELGEPLVVNAVTGLDEFLLLLSEAGEVEVEAAG